MIFNNPERHNAVSLDMWEATSAHPRRHSRRQRRPRHRADRRRRQGLRLGRRYFQVRERALHARGDRALQRDRRARPMPAIYEFPQADHRDDPRLLHRRRRRAWRCAATCASAGQFARSRCRRRSSVSAMAYAGLKRLVDLVGPSFAKEIFFTARQFDAAGSVARWDWSTASCRRPSSRTT